MQSIIEYLIERNNHVVYRYKKAGWHIKIKSVRYLHIGKDFEKFFPKSGNNID